MTIATQSFCKYTRHPEWFYRLAEDCEFKTRFRPAKPIDAEFVSMGTSGTLICRAGYGWNGPSGVPKRLHTGGMIYGALAHDALYGLMCEGLLSRSAESRQMADSTLREVMVDAGCWSATAWVFYAAVRCKGRDYANPRSMNQYREILVAPK